MAPGLEDGWHIMNRRLLIGSSVAAGLFCELPSRLFAESPAPAPFRSGYSCRATHRNGPVAWYVRKPSERWHYTSSVTVARPMTICSLEIGVFEPDFQPFRSKSLFDLNRKIGQGETVKITHSSGALWVNAFARITVNGSPIGGDFEYGS